MNAHSIEQVDLAVKAVLAGRLHQDENSSVFSGRLLNANAARGIRNTSGVILIPRAVVITPSGHDVLKARGIKVERTSIKRLSITQGEQSWGLSLDCPSGIAEAVRGSLVEGEESWVNVGHGTELAATWVAHHPSRAAALLTAEASVAVWKAHTFPGIRACFANDPDEVARAIQALGVNLLVIEPRGKSIPWVKHLCQVFRRGGLPRIPDLLKPELNSRRDNDEDRRGGRPRHVVPDSPSPAERALRDRLANAALGTRGKHGGAR